MNDQPKSERIRIGPAARMLGLSVTKVRTMVARNKVPGAGWIDGCLTFGVSDLEALIAAGKAEVERRACARPSVGYRAPSLSVAPFRAGSKSAKKSDGRFDEALQVLRDYGRKGSAKSR